MRELADADRVRRLMRAMGAAARSETAAYFSGGATAVLVGWRATTLDVDLLLEPEDDAVLRAIPALKDELHVNVELASPADFIPALAGWVDRSLFAGREGLITFYHFDPYAQVLAKLERDHAKDREDVAALVGRGLVDPQRALALFAEIEPQLYRFPAIDPVSFRRRVEAALAPGGWATTPR
jgi:hypothetical protein